MNKMLYQNNQNNVYPKILVKSTKKLLIIMRIKIIRNNKLKFFNKILINFRNKQSLKKNKKMISNNNMNLK